MARSTVHYADNETNRILKQLHRKLRPAGTPVQRVEYIIELLLLRIFEVKLKQDKDFKKLRKLFIEHNGDLLFSTLQTTPNKQILNKINQELFPFYSGILTKAGKVFQSNLPQKVQDQLVLIEEVFSNSNFTNNVKSGNLQEIISLVSEIDETRLLKTDLLGDAIESALSETGGTRDIGLFRTPDHIRQFMVGLIQPNFNDTVFDPACGTGGFLFDAFGYVIESVYGEGKWPGTRGHKELQSYFKSHFKSHKQKMPSVNIANNFYRTGVRGIEYLGMIRKMAAINFYIRGLNPQNIEQGDSLANYDPAMDGNSKTVVLANPPFGAERDQDAYPNVWENYSTESETTILFVKLMFESLKQDGHCAVVVSEGFLTWDQNSARALRKMLLKDANLKAIISLPQGVFVSKNGQGPKTSILVFEKGKRTKDVWYYKVTNDGFSMGTNRKEIKGCQLVETLDLWDKYVKDGKQCPETKHSFSIPAEWILRLDPRVKVKIRTETRQTMEAKGKDDKKKLKDKLSAQLKKKKIDKIEFEHKLAQFDSLLESKIQNETAKRIEKAHLNSFNLPNYKSGFADSQKSDWKDVFKSHKISEPLSLDEKFYRLKKADLTLTEAHKMIAAFDTENATELDIVREYLANLTEEERTKHSQLNTIYTLIKSKAKWQRVRLGEFLTPKYEKIKKNDYDGTVDIVSKISFKDGKIHFRDENSTGMDLYFANKGNLVTSKINVHQGAVAIAPKDLVCSTHYQVYEIDTNKINPNFLTSCLRTKEFLNQILEQKNKGIKNEQGAKFFLDFSIPLPPIEEQEKIVGEIQRHENIINSATLINDNIDLRIKFEKTETLTHLGEAVLTTKNGWSPVCHGGEIPVLTLSCLKNGKIDLNERKYTDQNHKYLDSYFIKENDFFYSRGNSSELVALAGIAKSVNENVVFPDLLTKVEFDEEKIIPEYAVYLFNTEIGRIYFGSVPKGGSPNMVKVSQKYMKRFQVPFMGNKQKQREIVAELDKQMVALEGVKQLAENSKNEVERILEEMWED